MTREEKQKAIDALKISAPVRTMTNKEFNEYIQTINQLMDWLEQEPKRGHWIGHREHCENLGVMPSGLGAYEWCSNCDCGIDVREWHKNHYNYCPNCGAKMVEPQESEV